MSAELALVGEVCGYLNAQRWDCVPRLANWAERYLGVRQSSPGCGPEPAKWLVSAVARAFEPGCRVDGVLLLMASQGAGKSAALQALFGSFYRGDALPEVGTRDFGCMVRDAWVVELDLELMSRSTLLVAKGVVLSRFDRVRPPYAREFETFPRSCVFAASITSPWLLDAVGNRHFWPVQCGAIDGEGLRRDRDQLWAEAFEAYRAGQAWW